jgi:hypothetical protein
MSSLLSNANTFDHLFLYILKYNGIFAHPLTIFLQEVAICSGALETRI